MKNKQTIKRIPYYAFSCKKSYYLTHPLKFLREIRTLIGNVKHRLLYSWDWPSLWNMDSFLGQLIPSMLKELATGSCGTPYDVTGEEYNEPHCWSCMTRSFLAWSAYTHARKSPQKMTYLPILYMKNSEPQLHEAGSGIEVRARRSVTITSLVPYRKIGHFFI